MAIAVAIVVSAAANISIAFDGSEFRVNGWVASAEPAEGWASVFPVYAAEGDVPPMAGSYQVRDGVLTFRPRFPGAAGVHYRAEFKPAGIEARFDGLSIANNPLAHVERIYPSADVLPSNDLRFYIFFSAPMSRGEAWQHLRLIDADTNRAVELPFLELEQELWDQSNQRLTVFFDPGRIKRGLVPTNTIGPPIVEGRRYKLVIDQGWHDARGVRLAEGFEKPFRGGPADRVPPEPKSWTVSAPAQGTRQPLIITFPKPMDYVLLQRMIGIFSGTGEVHGKIEVVRNEREWRFGPDEAWNPGSYRIVADNTLEDICGNHLDRPFDVDVFETVTKRIEITSSSIKFDVR